MRNAKQSNVFSVFFKPLLFGVLSGTVLCVCLLFFMAFTATKTDIPNVFVIPLAVVAVSIASFIGAFVAAKITKRNGWLIGLINAFALFIISIIAGWSFFKAINTDFIFIKLLIMLASGILGGIISVNVKPKKK